MIAVTPIRLASGGVTVIGVVTRFVAGQVTAYDCSGEPAAVAVFPVEPPIEPKGHAVAPDLRRAVYTTDDDMVCVDRDGNTVWRLAFGTRAEQRYVAAASCAFSPDGALVWLYRPDVMARRGDGPDQWVAVDAVTGDVVATAELDCVGQGGTQFAHPDGVHMLLDVGEGQDGSRVYRGHLHHDVIDLSAYPWTDRLLVGLAPDGRHFMTVHHNQEDVTFHTYPDGDVVLWIPVESFGYEPDEAYVEWTGGYLDARTAIVVIGGETEDEREWYLRHLVDVRTGQVLGTLDAQSRDVYDVQPLGDGSWLSTDDNNRIRRHTR
jgi:hypothetical protein